MKTREISGYVHSDYLSNQDLNYANITFTKNEFIDSVKCKLIIEIPERKIEITESQFEKLHEDFQHSNHGYFYKFIKERVFKDQP